MQEFQSVYIFNRNISKRSCKEPIPEGNRLDSEREKGNGGVIRLCIILNISTSVLLFYVSSKKKQEMAWQINEDHIALVVGHSLFKGSCQN